MGRAVEGCASHTDGGGMWGLFSNFLPPSFSSLNNILYKMSVCHLWKIGKQVFKETVMCLSEPSQCFTMGTGQAIFQITWRPSPGDVLGPECGGFCGPITSARGGGQIPSLLLHTGA